MFKEEEHPRDGDGKFTSKDTNIKYRQNASYGEIIAADKASVLTNSPTSGKIVGAKKKLSKIAGKPIGTYDLDTGEPVNLDSGFQVSFQRTSDNYQDDEHDRIANEISIQLNSKAYGGNFDEPEISFNAKTYEEAMEVAKKYNQKSIFDWELFNETGDADAAIIKNLAYEAGTDND